MTHEALQDRRFALLMTAEEMAQSLGLTIAQYVAMEDGYASESDTQAAVSLSEGLKPKKQVALRKELTEYIQNGGDLGELSLLVKYPVEFLRGLHAGETRATPEAVTRIRDAMRTGLLQAGEHLEYEVDLSLPGIETERRAEIKPTPKEPPVTTPINPAKEVPVESGVIPTPSDSAVVSVQYVPAALLASWLSKLIDSGAPVTLYPAVRGVLARVG
jgi:hypothetical protein